MSIDTQVLQLNALSVINAIETSDSTVDLGIHQSVFLDEILTINTKIVVIDDPVIVSRLLDATIFEAVTAVFKKKGCELLVSKEPSRCENAPVQVILNKITSTTWI